MAFHEQRNLRTNCWSHCHSEPGLYPDPMFILMAYVLSSSLHGTVCERTGLSHQAPPFKRFPGWRTLSVW